jgi:hypothetical protein
MLARGEEIRPELTIRVHRPSARTWGETGPGATRSSYVDTAWNGKAPVVLGSSESGPDTQPLKLATA